ncbi:MAG: GntR family transcriptional regulator [Spirochaetaceae bacterium]|nr:MAG: GntR family transcriptional regulator [Spirochaetaceae bacterium]
MIELRDLWRWTVSNSLNMGVVNVVGLRDTKVDKTIPVPLYYQVKQHLRTFIAQCSEGDPIPTEQELCSHFGVSRPTVRQAIVELVSEGHLIRSKGKGTFVTKPKVQRSFFHVLQSFNDEMRTSGRNPTTEVLELCRMSAAGAIAAHLSLESGSDVYFLRRLRFADNRPLMVVNSFLPECIVPNLERHDFQQVGLHALLTSAYGLMLNRAVRAVEAVEMPAAESRLLQVRLGSPAHYVETTFFVQDDVPVEFAVAWYRGDASRFTFELRSSDVTA